MSNNNHRLSRQQAKDLIDELKRKRAGSNGPFKNLPDGFIFPVEIIRQLISHPEAVNFVIQLGWKVTTGPRGRKEQMTPVLFVADSNMKALSEIPVSLAEGVQGEGNVTKASATFTEATSLQENAGGFINEGKPFPPPEVSTDD